ncbi:hypothetical protein Tco_0241367 [Tanacetum coccineum]
MDELRIAKNEVSAAACLHVQTPLVIANNAFLVEISRQIRCRFTECDVEYLVAVLKNRAAIILDSCKIK